MTEQSSRGRGWYFLVMCCTWIGLYGVVVLALNSSGCRQQETAQSETDQIDETRNEVTQLEADQGETALPGAVQTGPIRPEAESTETVQYVVVPGQSSDDVETGGTEGTDKAGIANSPLAVEQVRASFEDGEDLYAQKSYREASIVFAAYTKNHPDNLWGHYMYALACWKNSDLNEAENSLKLALTIDPDHVKSQTNLARVYLDMGSFAKAHKHAAAASRLDPVSNSTQRVLGRALHSLGLAEDAIAAYENALAINDRDVWSMNNIGLILIEEERFLEAILPLARAIQIREDIAVIYNNLGIALERTRRYEAAAQAYCSAMALNSGDQRAEVNLLRVEELQEEPGLSQWDLDLLAQRYVDQNKRVDGDPVSTPVDGEAVVENVVDPVVATEATGTTEMSEAMETPEMIEVVIAAGVAK